MQVGAGGASFQKDPPPWHSELVAVSLQRLIEARGHQGCLQGLVCAGDQ